MSRMGIAEQKNLCEVAKPGVKEYEVTAACEHTCMALGADSYFGQWSMGPSTYITFRGGWPIDRKLKKGDMIACETNPRYEGTLATLVGLSS